MPARSASFVKLHESYHMSSAHKLLRLFIALAPLLATAAVSSLATYTLLSPYITATNSHSSSHAGGADGHPLVFNQAATHYSQPTPWEQHTQGVSRLFPRKSCHPRCKLRIALVNDAPYHLEVVAGFLQVLGMLPDSIELVWYQASQQTADSKYSAVQLLEMQGFTQLLEYLPLMKGVTDTPAPCDFAIFISPEYFERRTEVFLNHAKPHSALMVVHNGANHANQRLAKLHPRLHFTALGPHVAATVREVLHLNCHWMMATWQYKPKAPCNMDAKNAMSCMHGFAIQGNFESARRNYTHVWDMLRNAVDTGHVPTPYGSRPFHLHLVGRGLVSSLQLPPAVQNITTVHYNLAFPAYYEQLHHAHALLLVLGSEQYYTRKISSTIVSSLVAGVPVVADDAILRAYTFFKPDQVLYMAPGEDEMAVMLRVLRMTPAEVYAVRQRVVELAAHLNQRTLQLLQSLFPTPADLGQC